LKIGRGIVPSRFAVLSRFGVKFVEVAGAGLASALCAYCLGQIGQQPAAPPPIVQVLPPGSDAIRLARDDRAVLAALARRDVDTATKPEQAASAPVVAAGSKPANPTPTVQMRRNQRTEQQAPGKPQPRAREPLPIQPPSAASNSAPKPAVQATPALLGRDGFATPGPSGHEEEERPLFARLKQIPSWFLPDNDRIFGIVPRPPLPVGEFFHSAM
jgi:hypothetical protein